MPTSGLPTLGSQLSGSMSGELQGQCGGRRLRATPPRALCTLQRPTRATLLPAGSVRWPPRSPAAEKAAARRRRRRERRIAHRGDDRDPRHGSVRTADFEAGTHQHGPGRRSHQGPQCGPQGTPTSGAASCSHRPRAHLAASAASCNHRPRPHLAKHCTCPCCSGDTRATTPSHCSRGT